MKTGLRIKPIKGSVANIYNNKKRVPADIPLGTAAWFKFRDGVTPTCKIGDLFLGMLPSGGAVGFKDDRHVMITAVTRSGKGASFNIPNLTFWNGSVFCIDPKGENAMVTARRRGKGSRFCKGKKQKVRLLDPFDIVLTHLDTFRDIKVQFNPLDILRLHPREAIDLAAQIAESLVLKENSNEPFWEESARALIKALILHVVSWKGYKDHERNLVTVWRLLRSGDEPASINELLRMNGIEQSGGYDALFDAMRQNKAYGGVVSNAGHRFGNMVADAPRSFQGMVQVACTSTDFIDSEQMRHCLARSDFALSDLKTDPKGMSLYLCLPQRYMESHSRWLRMIVTLMIFEMERTAHQPKCGHPVLTILDEFPSLGRMKVIENAVAQIAGYGVKLVMVNQSLGQLAELYKENWETLVANCGVKLFHNNEDHRTREYVAKLIGEHEVVRTTNTQSTTQGTSRSSTESRTYGSNQSTGTTYTSGFSSGGQGGGMNSSTAYNRTRGYSESMSASRMSGQNHSTTKGTNETIHKRYLVNPDEVGRFFGDPEKPRAIVLIAGLQPLCLNRIQYFDCDAFAGWFDYHRDHPLPRTLPQVAQDKEAVERQRQEEAKRKAQQAEAKRAQEYRESVAKWERKQESDRRNAEMRREHAEWQRKQEIKKWVTIAAVVVGWIGALWVYSKWF